MLRDKWTIKRMSEVMCAALVSNNFLPIPSKYSFHMKEKSDSSRPENYKVLKPLWLSNWISTGRVIACFPQASMSRVAASACPSDVPHELGLLLLQSNPSIISWNSLREWLSGAQTWNQTWTLPPDQRVVKVLSASKFQNNLCWAQILFRSVENAEIEDSYELIPTLMHQTENIYLVIFAVLL